MNDTVWRLAAFDTFSAESYPLDGEYGSAEEAREAGKQRLRELEEDQTMAALHLKSVCPP